MFLTGTRHRVLLFLATLVLAMGCDDRRSDRELQKAVDEGHQFALHGTTESLGKAREVLESVSSDSNASAALQTNAKSMLAQVELEAARAAQRDIDRQMMVLNRLVADIAQLGQQIATINALVAGYRTYDPKDGLAAIDRNIADATGGADKAAWFEHENSQIPTLTVLKQDIARLEGEIAALQDRHKQLQAQHQQVLMEADQASREAEGPRNEQTLQAFKRASDLRKRAADLVTEMNGVEAALHPLQKDLDVARGQQQIIENLIQELEQQAQALRGGWQAIQQQMTAQAALAQAILQGAPGAASATVVPPGGSISSKATELAKIVATVQTLREDALNNARNAASHYEQAVVRAEELRRELSALIDEPRNRSRSEQPAWTTLRDTMHPAAFRLHLASAQRTLAGILAEQARELQMRIELRNQLAPILETARLPIPEQLQVPDADREREQALTAANQAFEAAHVELERITEGQAPEAVQNAAYVGRVLTLYAWSQLNRDAGDEKAAAEHLELARAVRNAATDRTIAFPAMPAALAVAPPRPAPAPTTPDAATTPAPSDQRADQPADASPDEQAIRAVLASFLEALDKGDADAARAVSQIEPGQEAYFDQLLALVAESKKFSEALREKFGDQAQAAAAAVPNITDALRMVKITVTGDEGFVQAAVPGAQPQKMFVRVDDQWKVLFAAPDNPQATQQREIVDKLSTALPTITADVQAGKYATMQEVLAALMQAIGQTPPPPAPQEQTPPATEPPPPPASPSGRTGTETPPGN